MDKNEAELNPDGFSKRDKKGIPHFVATSELTINPCHHYGDDPSTHPLLRWKIPF